MDDIATTTHLERIGLAAGAAVHDLNNVLAIIAANAQLAQEAPEEASASLVQIEAAARQGMHIISRILDFSEQDIELVCHDLCTLASDALNLMRSQIPSNIKVILNLEPDFIGMMADRVEIIRSICNIIINAVQSIDGPGEISVTVKPNGSWALLEIADTGNGIEAERLQDIFTPLYTTKLKGSGLGLAVVKAAVKTHGGSISIQSTPGLGTAIILMFPLVACLTKELGA